MDLPDIIDISCVGVGLSAPDPDSITGRDLLTGALREEAEIRWATFSTDADSVVFFRVLPVLDMGTLRRGGQTGGGLFHDPSGASLSTFCEGLM